MPPLEPWPGDVEVAAKAIGLDDIPFPGLIVLGGPHNVRHAHEKFTDFHYGRAASAHRWLVGAARPPDPLKELVEGFLGGHGVGTFAHPFRKQGLALRRRLIPRMYALCRRVGLAAVRSRAAAFATDIERLAVPIPRSVDDMLRGLKGVNLRAEPGAFDVTVESTGHRVLRVGTVRVEYRKGRERRSIGLRSREGQFLLALVRRQSDADAPLTVVSHVRSALLDLGVKLLREDRVYSLSQPLRDRIVEHS